MVILVLLLFGLVTLGAIVYVLAGLWLDPYGPGDRLIHYVTGYRFCHRWLPARSCSRIVK